MGWSSVQASVADDSLSNGGVYSMGSGSYARHHYERYQGSVLDSVGRSKSCIYNGYDAETGSNYHNPKMLNKKVSFQKNSDLKLHDFYNYEHETWAHQQSERLHHGIHHIHHNGPNIV